jgi:phenylacetate-coenzyme A ligase PaaK-like adenylate-forming protein
MSYYNNFSIFDYEKPYSLSVSEKKRVFMDFMNELTSHHAKHSETYANIIRSMPGSIKAKKIEDIPFLPVRIFKHLDLLSIPRENIFKTLTSSGTTGQNVSKIFLSRENSSIQTKILSSIMSDFLGKQRFPMVVIDAEDTIRNRQNFNARAAGILGFSFLGRDFLYALNSSMEVRAQDLQDYISKYHEVGVYAFGFTFMVWKFLYQYLLSTNTFLDFGPKSILIHGGGWKKLSDESVSNEMFKSKLYERVGLRKVHNYYGMVEQTGSIYMECEQGFLHTSNYSDVLIRDPMTFKPCRVGELGLLQVFSLLPHSYPGHSLLTEDLGVLFGEDGCACGRPGRYFQVHGRQKSAEARGCSDVRQA